MQSCGNRLAFRLVVALDIPLSVGWNLRNDYFATHRQEGSPKQHEKQARGVFSLSISGYSIGSKIGLDYRQRSNVREIQTRTLSVRPFNLKAPKKVFSMSTPDENGNNPYQAPVAGLPSQLNSENTSAEDQVNLTKFRQQIHALGGFWIFIGSIVLAAVAVLGFGYFKADDLERNGFAISIVAIGIMSAMSIIWILIGVLSCLKQIWAVYVGLILSYISLLMQVIQMNICGVVILIIVIMQSHRVISLANRLRAAGIPLSAKP